MENVIPTAGRRTLLDMNAYQWTVILAAWLGWGFDIFDSLLMNYVAPNMVPTLLGIQLGTPAAQSATLRWTGILTSLLLLGWCAGGIIFGKVADRIGRTKTLLLTMLLYSLGTAACAFAPNIWVLVIFRIVSSLGIGGEWAAGAAMVAEVVPEKRRVEAGALLYPGLLVAVCVLIRSRAGGRRVRCAAICKGARALAKARRGNPHTREDQRVVYAEISRSHDQWLVHGDDRACNVVELQCVHCRRR
jgi:hypothetical protein